ncbi:MAG: hypothetical protein AAFS05_10660, partial [Pseudomonadota bacterium]
MASYQYVYHMDGVSKTYPGGKKCFENIRLSFLPLGVKAGNDLIIEDEQQGRDQHRKRHDEQQQIRDQVGQYAIGRGE